MGPKRCAVAAIAAVGLLLGTLLAARSSLSAAVGAKSCCAEQCRSGRLAVSPEDCCGVEVGSRALSFADLQRGAGAPAAVPDASGSLERAPHRAGPLPAPLPAERAESIFRRLRSLRL